MSIFGIILVILGFLVALIIIIVILYLRYRTAEKEKSRVIFFYVCEQTRLARELEHAMIENQTLEKILQSMISSRHCEEERRSNPEKN